jgi:hypothetical protein
MSKLSAVEQIAKLRADFETAAMKLKSDALAELKGQLSTAKAEVTRIEAEIAELNGKPARTRKSGGGAGLPDVPTVEALKAMLKAAPGKTLNRKAFNDAGFNLKSALELAKGDSKTFSYTQNKAQGTVTLK